MGPVNAEVEIDAPREEAFAAIGDLARRPSFTDHFASDFHLTRIESSGMGAGARFRLRAPLHRVWVDTAIETVEAPHRIVERGRGGRSNRVPSTTLWELLEGSGSLTRVRVSHWTEPSNHLDRVAELATAASVWQQRAWHEALRRLREQLEAGAAPQGLATIAGGNPHATGVP